MSLDGQSSSLADRLHQQLLALYQRGDLDHAELDEAWAAIKCHILAPHSGLNAAESNKNTPPPVWQRGL